MNTRKSVRARTASAPAPLALTVALLAGCGDSDLPEHHRELLAAAAEEEGGASATVEPGLGAAAGGGDPGAAPIGSVPNPAPVAPEPAEPEPTEPEPTEPEPVEPEPAEPEPTEPEPAEPEPIEPEPAEPEPAEPEPIEPEPTEPEPVEPEPVEPEPTAPEPTEPEPVEPEPTEPEPTEPEPTEPEPVEPAPTEPAPEPAPVEPAPAAPVDAAGSDPSTEGSPVEGVDLDGYALVFADEFDGTELDPANWKTAFEYGNARIENELQYYVDTLGGDADFGHDPFALGGGMLRVRAVQTPTELATEAMGREWLSGVLSSATTGAGGFEMQRGDYAEARVDLPEGAGLGSMFTLVASDYASPPRPVVTVMRHDGADADELLHDYRFTDEGGERRSPGAWQVQDDALPAGFHTVGVSWDEEGLLYFVDGEATYRIVGESLPAQPLYLVLNLAVGGVSRSGPDAATPSPAELVVDHVRVWRPNP